MKTFDGYKKQALTDVYALLAGGGHKPLSEFSMAHTHPYLPLNGGTLTGPLEIKSSVNNNYNEGLRITRAGNSWAGITFGSSGLAGAPTNGWFAALNPSNQFIIAPNGSSSTTGLTLNIGSDIKWKNNTIWHAGNDGSGSGLDADLLDGYHASSFALVNNINYADLYAQKFITGKLNDGVTRWLVYAFNGNQTQTVDNLLSKIPDKVLSPNGSNVVTQLTTGIYLWEDNNIGSGDYANSYTGYARTYLYSNSAQTLTFVIYTDDNSSIFLNNTLLATPLSCQNTSLSFSLVKGWNKIEIIWYEGGGGDGFHVNYNGSRLHNSFLIDCFAIDSNNYANSAGSVAWGNVIGKPSSFTPSAHTHTVFNNNLMIKGTNGISDSASIHLGIGDSDTGFKWISDGKC